MFLVWAFCLVGFVVEWLALVYIPSAGITGMHHDDQPKEKLLNGTRKTETCLRAKGIKKYIIFS